MLSLWLGRLSVWFCEPHPFPALVAVVGKRGSSNRRSSGAIRRHASTAQLLRPHRWRVLGPLRDRESQPDPRYHRIEVDSTLRIFVLYLRPD